MKHRLMFLGLWTDEFNKLLTFLVEQQYDTEITDRMMSMLKERE